VFSLELLHFSRETAWGARKNFDNFIYRIFNGFFLLSKGLCPICRRLLASRCLTF
jgi:hypothetical protein